VLLASLTVLGVTILVIAVLVIALVVIACTQDHKQVQSRMVEGLCVI
jgi:hypothetical protein